MVAKSQNVSPPAAAESIPPFLRGDGECAKLIASRDWSTNPLGPIERWPQSLRTATAILLRSPVPIVMLWGEDGIMIYNDAYSVFAGGRHPELLGCKVREGWPEVADFNDNVMRVGLAGGTLAYKDQELTLYRHGRAEQVFMNLDYSPVLDENGEPAGVLAIVVETTERVATERRVQESNERFRALVAASSNSMYRMSADWTEMRQLEGRGFLSPTEQPRTDWLQAYIHPDDQAHVLAAIEEAIADRSTFDLEHRIRLADGTFGWTHSRAVPILDERGAIVEWFGAAMDVTERKRSEEALRESEARFRLMADAVPQIIWITDGEGRTEFFNRQWSSYTGVPYEPTTAAEVAAQHVHPDDGPATMAAFEAARAGGGIFDVEHRIRSASGGYRWFLVRAEPYRDPSTNEVVRWFGASVDIHDRKLAEARLRELNETLEQRVVAALAERKVFADVVESSTAAVTALDLDYNVLAINGANVDAFERVFGRRPAVGDNLLHLLRDMPEHRAQLEANWSRALAGEEYTIVQEFGAAGLERVTFEVRFHALRDRDGQRIGASSIAHDVTERALAQARLAEAEAARREADALYRAYFEHTPEALFVIDVEPDGRFVLEQINPAHEAGVGLRRDEVRGKGIEEILPPDIAERVLATYRHVVETGAIYQYREVFDLRGDPQHWDTSLVPVRDADGRVTRLIGSSRDVTRQVIAEEALRQSRKMEAMGQLTGGVAHDFNNLLTPIVGSLDMLQRNGVGGEREQRLIAGAIQSAERAKTLVQRLLAFARRQPLQPVPVDIAQLVASMGDLIASTTGPQVRVVVEAPADLPAAKADANQLEMALLNLAVNARDAMPEGGTLRISATAEKVRMEDGSTIRSGDYVRLSVADTGVGMDEATLDRAVEPFFSTKGIGKGTGLGLSMAHGLASQLGGALTIKSRRGVGTNVELWLPVSLAPAEAKQASPQPQPIRPAKGIVLLVDDEELVRMSTADMLAELGFEVIEAGSAEEALGLVRKGVRPDVLVTDHLMPGMTGTDLARALKSERPEMRVLIVSGYAETDGVAPEFARLRKPFRNEELVAGLSSLEFSPDDRIPVR